ncbi:hypothetical protein ASG12_09850 [Williamsia sp. Leaf354]|uniref:hypothetical protein n=1 Tax=Williamsia sp. Leaf354 TaxID=1736349 RepID=UPI000701DF30|nr:hypothetical protein [Williamsia sp. Leaf354]KQR98693.1 hypothetical protein ASG12_09850 [Williamsia sp. Leaf354]
MTVIAEGRTAGAVRTAERVLSARAGSPVVLDDPVDLAGSGRTDVVRVRVAQNPLSPDRSLVIKVLPADEPADAFARELASYKYATALPMRSRPGPQLIASDSAERLIVLSDLGHGRSMSALLASTDWADPSHAISAWGQALGRMHAATVGGEDDFAALLRHGPARGDVEALTAQVQIAVSRAPEVLGEHLGVDVSTGFVELLTRAQLLFAEGEHRAFSPSDVGPPNILINDDGVQFMDYEWGGFRDATLDIGYAVVTFGAELAPRWADRRADLETAMVDAWRSEIQAIWPALSHDGELNRKVLTARALWVWLATVWMLPVELGDDRHARGLALRTSDPAVVVARWTDLAAAARRTGDQDIAADADAIGAALDAAWLR